MTIEPWQIHDCETIIRVVREEYGVRLSPDEAATLWRWACGGWWYGGCDAERIIKAVNQIKAPDLATLRTKLYVSAATIEQPAPHGTGAEVLPLVLRDLARSVAPAAAVARIIDALVARAEKGAAKYGESLRCGNGRSAAIDLLQELLDALMYARQWEEETGDHEVVWYIGARIGNLVVDVDRLIAEREAQACTSGS